MAHRLRSSFLWQFVAGFALGAIGLAAAHATEPKAEPARTEIAAR
ncbi:hypothetical protein [Sphingomonas sp.]|jgi:hypothetical protein|nr:hypothetical protein [Sphingomonas sp.]HEU0043828.1 hypothetical protein [Sphingomonas sp.]